MTYREALREGSNRLEGSGTDTPYLDALVILTDAARIKKEQLYAAFNEPAESEAIDRFRQLVEGRRRGVPVAYLIRRQEFFGRAFYVDERVLIPRADTETLVERALDLIENLPTIRRVHDLGTGSGCIALTIKAERPDLFVSASDVSRAACDVFAANAEQLGLDVPITETVFFETLSGPFDLIVSNAPYLTDEEAQAMEDMGWREPQKALRAGPDGLDCIEQIISESVHYLPESGHLLLEAAPPQVPIIREMMKQVGFEGLTVTEDLAGRARVVGGVKNG